MRRPGPVSGWCRRTDSWFPLNSPCVSVPNQSVEQNDTADVLAGVHVAVALGDLVEGVVGGDHVVEGEGALLVEPEHLRNVVGRVRRAEEGALDAFLEERQFRERDGDAD